MYKYIFMYIYICLYLWYAMCFYIYLVCLWYLLFYLFNILCLYIMLSACNHKCITIYIYIYIYCGRERAPPWHAGDHDHLVAEHEYAGELEEHVGESLACWWKRTCCWKTKKEINSFIVHLDMWFLLLKMYIIYIYI